MTLTPAMRGLLSWLLILPGAFLVLAGIIDYAVGPELAEQEPGVGPGEGGPSWYGLIIVLLGMAVIALGAWIGRARTEPNRRTTP